ncbi:MAG: hypothetical protein ACREE2_14330 [Stellaceae bacterium]
MSDDQLMDQVKAGLASGVETARDLAGKAQTAGSTIRDAAVKTGNRASDAAAKAYQQGAQAADVVSRTTAEQPLTALLVAVAIGYGIAYLIHGR